MCTSNCSWINSVQSLAKSFQKSQRLEILTMGKRSHDESESTNAGNNGTKVVRTLLAANTSIGQHFLKNPGKKYQCACLY